MTASPSSSMWAGAVHSARPKWAATHGYRRLLHFAAPLPGLLQGGLPPPGPPPLQKAAPVRAEDIFCWGAGRGM
eukprot:3172769-Alexandrium_andersonii.AAC.1